MLDSKSFRAALGLALALGAGGSGFSATEVFDGPWRGWGSSASDYFVVTGSVGSASGGNGSPLG